MISAQRFVAFGPKSPIECATDEAWRRYIASLEVQPLGAISKTGALGSYGTRPYRLVELGYASSLRRTGLNGECQVCEFNLPWTQSRFLADSIAQYTVLAKSMQNYYDALRHGDLRMPNDASMAGVLSVLHVGGIGALKNWNNLFENTRALYEKAKGAF